MKKILFGLLAVAATLAARADEWKAISFLGVPAVVVSNTFSGVTNLSLQAGGTNMTGQIFTNSQNQRIIVGTTTNAAGALVGVTTPLIGQVPMSPKSLPYISPINSSPWTNYQGPVYLAIRGIGGSGADTAMTIRFSQVEGTNNLTGASAQWSTVFVPSSGAFALRTNVPMSFFAGATAIQCDTITAGDTDASSQVTITDLDLIQIW